MPIGFGCCCPACCCDPAPSNYLAVFSGVTDGTSTGCTFANRSFCLCMYSCDLYQAPGFIAEEPLPTDCVQTFNTSHANLEFLCDDGIVRLTVYAACNITGFSRALAIYELARASWNCSGSNVMSKISNTGDCGSWPATITLTPNDTSVSCNCQCGHNVGGTADFRPYVYDLRFGPITSGGTCVNDCSCDVPYTRICMQNNGGCIWIGYWFPPGRAEITNLNTFGGSEIPGQCSPAYYFNRAVVIMFYDPSSDAFILTLGPSIFATGYYRYSIAASSFNATGNNTFSFLDATYASCTMPATVDFDFYSRDNLDCQNDLFRCNVCNGGTMAIGWKFTLSGITGTEVDLGALFYEAGCKATPCLAFNGNYCLSNNGTTCDWSTFDYALGVGVGFTPDPISYKRLDGSVCTYGDFGENSLATRVIDARMSIEGGMVVLMISLSWLDAPPRQVENCGKLLVYAIGVDAFDCNGPNTLNLLCGHELSAVIPSSSTAGFYDIGQCDCTNVPATVTITPTTECGIPPSSECLCLPAGDYSPRAVISGIGAQSCDDCVCYSVLDICLDTVDADCQWSKSFTLPTSDAASCKSAARKAVLLIGSSTVTITIYDISNNILAVFSAARSGFSCDDSAFSLSFATDNDSLCDWSAATCTLDMHGAACATCACADAVWLATVTYASNSYAFCVSVGSCTGTSAATKLFGSDDELKVTVEFGALPTKYARILVYHKTSGGSFELIGVYDYLLDFDNNFNCTGGQNLNLTSGNASECGGGISVSGKTSNLGATAGLNYQGSGCITCDGVIMPPTILATFTDGTGLCCTTGENTTLVFNPTSGHWEGTISCSSGEFVQLTLDQGGTTCTSLRLSAVFVNGCTVDVSNQPPQAGCSCGNAVFVTAGGSPPLADTITVSW